MNTPFRVSVVILTNKRPLLLKRCLNSILENQIDVTKTEVIVIVNGEGNQETLDVLKQYPKFFRVLKINESFPGEARNHAIREARFEWLFFLDDDAYLPESTFTNIERILRKFPDYDVLGGPNLTPPTSNSFQAAAGKALASRFGAHHSSRRFKEQAGKGQCGEEAVMLCNLLVRKEALNKSGVLFHSTLACNEENLMLQQLKAKGAKIFYDSSFFVFHDRRKKAFDFARQIFKYGLGRSQNTRIRPNSFRWQHGFPTLCILLAMFLPFFWFVPLLATYFTLIVAGSIRKKSARLLYIFPLLHVSYGLGFLVGCLSYVPYCIPLSRRVALWAVSATSRIARS